MTFLESMIERAQADRKVIVLPEGDDARTLEAAQEILARDVARSSTRAPLSCASPWPPSSWSCAAPRA